jgi:glycosyltransferase involved in cell wall biosynthesis
MKIGFDAKRAFHNKSGLGNYARTLITNLHFHYLEEKLMLFNPSPARQNFITGIADQNVREVLPVGLSSKIPAYWRSFKIPSLLNKYGVEIYHGLSNELPFNIKKANCKTVVTIHDLIFIRYPQLYPLIDRTIYEFKFRKACNEADHIIAISDQTKQDIIEFFNIPSNKITVVYQSCSSIFLKRYNNSEISEIEKQYNLPASYLLYVGTIEERKNLLTIVKALKELNRNSIPLVVVGKQTAYLRQVQDYIIKNDLSKQVVFLSNVPNEHLPYIYQKSDIFIYPSTFEGFGIPIIEALTSGTPVITSTGSCFSEAGGRHSVYIDPKNHVQLANEIEKLLNSKELRTEMSEKGLSYSQKFNSATTSSNLMVVYKKLMA